MLAPDIQKYIDDHSNANDALLEEIERSTHLHTIQPQMLSGRVQGKFLTMLTSLIDAERVLEIGTFTAYGTVCLAKGLNTAKGKVVTIEANPEHSFLIKKHIAMSGLEQQIEYLTGDALQIIPQREELWDLVYIDANKQEYIQYYETVIDRVKPGGLILSDNVLWSGKVVSEPDDADARVINQYNALLAGDARIEVIILPIRDGLSVARVNR